MPKYFLILRDLSLYWYCKHHNYFIKVRTIIQGCVPKIVKCQCRVFPGILLLIHHQNSFGALLWSIF